MPKLVILNPKGQKIIHVLSPTIKTTRQARKYMEKTKPTTHSNHQSKDRKRLPAAQSKRTMERCSGDWQHNGNGKTKLRWALCLGIPREKKALSQSRT
jgi:bisphosphoglycerate-dependent phosphoglycerate mutase